MNIGTSRRSSGIWESGQPRPGSILAVVLPAVRWPMSRVSGPASETHGEIFAAIEPTANIPRETTALTGKMKMRLREISIPQGILLAGFEFQHVKRLTRFIFECSVTQNPPISIQ